MEGQRDGGTEGQRDRGTDGHVSPSLDLSVPPSLCLSVPLSLGLSLFLIVITWVAYWPMLGADFGFVNYDDETYIINNEEVKAGLIRPRLSYDPYPGPHWI